LEIKKGELFGLLGPNGAGKTTLVKRLCTLLPPDGGTAKINGYDITKQQLQVISYVVPQCYFFTCIRLMLTGWTLSQILPDLLILALMCAIIVPLGYAIYYWCLKTARRNGTLSWF